MTHKIKSQLEILVERLDRELIARGAQIPVEEMFRFKDKEGTPQRNFAMKRVKKIYQSAPPLDKALSHINTDELFRLLRMKAVELREHRGIWGNEDRLDFYEIKDEHARRSAACVAAITSKKNLIEEKKGFSTLKHKNYGKSFNLCDSETFHDQPIAAGRLCTGFLVKEDVIATAGHCADEKSVKHMRIVFGYKMLAPSMPETQIPHDNIYAGVKIIHSSYNRNNGSDWALVKLDRKVVEQAVATLSGRDISCDQQVYILGHPCGLPLKYSAGAQVREASENLFSADLSVYCGNSGSPVFNKDTHEVIGIVIRGDNQDFRWTGKGFVSVVYPCADLSVKKPQCTKVSQFIEYCV
jgi:V8-like Glu-specific endopeptidase